MKTYLISYNLKNPEIPDEHQKIAGYIQSHEVCLYLLKYVWLIMTNKSVFRVRDELSLYAGSIDKVLVVDVTETEWSSYNLNKKTVEWMKNNLL